MAPDWLVAGIVGRPHGLDGSFHVVRPRAGALALDSVVRVGEVETTVTRRAGTDDRPIVRVAIAETREAVEALRGSELSVGRETVAPLDADEWWADELVGCAVLDGAQPVGVVTGLLGLPSCEALEIERTEGGELLVPLVGDAVRTVDVTARRIDVDLGFLGEET